MTAGIFAFCAIIGGVAVYTLLARAVGRAAENKGRSVGAWTAIAWVSGLVLPAIAVACMRDDPAAARSSWARMTGQPVGYPPALPQGHAHPGAAAAGAIRQLEQLRTEGLITTQEFEARKNQILDRL